MHHFGEPLVQSPSDFGTRSTPPSHPELLDYLAATFMDDGWSLKRLHRRILLSNAYQQASVDRPACRQVDPENRLLWRFHRQRLDLEAMRDTLLSVSGTARSRAGAAGRSTSPATRSTGGGRSTAWSTARACPAFSARSISPAPTSRPSGGRRRPCRSRPCSHELALRDRAGQVAGAPARSRRQTVAGRTGSTSLYQAVFARRPDEAETDLAARFIEEVATHKDGSTLDPWEQYAQVLLMSNEFLFVD